MKVDIFNTDKKYDIIYADPPFVENDRELHRRGKESLQGDGRMKNRNCPNKDMCWDYNASRCEGCAIGQKIEKLNRKIKRLQAEKAELCARLDKAVELPRIIHPNKAEWHIQYQYESGIIDSKIKFSIEAAEACLKEIKEKKQ